MRLGLGLKNMRQVISGPALGPELVTNGDFTLATGWTLEAPWTIGSGVLNAPSNTAFARAYRSDLNIPISTTVRVVVVISAYTSGLVNVQLEWFLGGANVSTGNISGVGTHSFDLVTTASGATTVVDIFQAATGFIGSIDSVSVKAR